MSSWNEKPHATPAINVNLTPCACFGNYANIGSTAATRRPVVHLLPCRDGSPVLIPCPLPRSVEMTLRVGECAAFEHCADGEHDPVCPARLVRVTCSIGGETWEVSHINTCETEDGIGLNTTIEHRTCEDRWGFVRSAVLGHSLIDCPEAIHNLRAQRDAVFAKIATLKRTEDAERQARRDAFAELSRADVSFSMSTPVGSTASDMLRAYVGKLIEHVAVLP